MLLDETHEKLGWPRRVHVLKPTGWGPKIHADLADQKLGSALRRRPDTPSLAVGVLTPDALSDNTEAPLAVVCEFSKPVTNAVLEHAHKLAWNFSRTPLLITCEPHRVLAWSCCQPPTENIPDKLVIGELPPDGDLFSSLTQPEHAVRALHWVNLVSGTLLATHSRSFEVSTRADHLLLENLRFIRRKLHDEQLPYDICHDLLARVIFVQFLFQRQDSTGSAALSDELLQGRIEGQLSEYHPDLASILSNYKDTYALFKWLNTKFNGDLFPGQGETEEEQEREWQTEKKKVRPKHLKLLGEFVSGSIAMETGQRSLWPHYSFDMIPLEFISSVYELFLRETAKQTKAYYTPSHLVDFMLDAVLPWDSSAWDVKVCDPACGSGIYLVKAYQRLIQRWKNANPGLEPKTAVLRPMLEQNLVGIDLNPHAIRVASFSLYLSMCDAMDPRHYWKQVMFPRLRNKTLLSTDFFSQEVAQRFGSSASQFDLVIGNAPWGKNSITDHARTWAVSKDWPITYNDIGPLFLPKSASIVRKQGVVSMLQPAGVTLFNRSSHARNFRRKLFTTFEVQEVVNLAALRFSLFNNAVGPACIMTFHNDPPEQGHAVAYLVPKTIETSEDKYRILIEPHEVHAIPHDDAAADPHVWTALMWGQARDLALVKRLARFPNLDRYKSAGAIKAREGIIRGNRGRTQQEITGRRILAETTFPPDTFVSIDAQHLPVNTDPQTDSKASTDFSAFDVPQLIIKQSWLVDRNRFQAALVASNLETGGILCSDSYVSVHATANNNSILEAAWLSYNSKIATYYQLLTSGQFATFVPKPLEAELRKVPLPDSQDNLLDGINTLEDVDERVRNLLKLKKTEWALVQDLFNFTLPDFKGDHNSPGRQPTRRTANGNHEPDLILYIETFARVLKASFGTDKSISATIFSEAEGRSLPVRLIALDLNVKKSEEILIQRIDDADLSAVLITVYSKWLSPGSNNHSSRAFQRALRLYTIERVSGAKVPRVYIVKPDQRRHWLASAALRDADETATEIFMAKAK